MKDFFVSMIKSKNSGRKITAIAVMVTAVLLVAALLVLIISSVVFAARGNNGANDDQAPAIEIIYETVTELDSKIASLGESVKIKDNRSAHPAGGTNQYYATISPISVLSTIQKNLDAMLIANYNANKSSMICETKDQNGKSNPNCNIPFVNSSISSGTGITILTYDEKQAYTTEWMTNNAARYGFVQNDSTFIYVGVPHAAYMAKCGITSLASYVNALNESESNVSITASDALTGTTATYEIYHIAKGEELSVPSNFAYTVISDGNGGYIISVNLSRPITSAGK